MLQELAYLATALATAVGAVGLVFTALELKRSQRQAVTAFEDDFSREYRQLVNALPVEVFLDGEGSSAGQVAALSQFYRYFDLCNEQVFLRAQERVSPPTWQLWCDGIRANMQRPAFAEAWAEVRRRAPGDFGELRWLEKHSWKADPISMPTADGAG